MKTKRIYFVFFLLIFCSAIQVKASRIFTFNKVLNKFVKELYISIPDTSRYGIRDLQLVRVARDVEQGIWIISIGNKQGKILSEFYDSSKAFDERKIVLNLVSKNNSNINGYVIVNWNVFKSNTTNSGFLNNNLTSQSSDINSSTIIRKLVNSKYVYVSSSLGKDYNIGTIDSPLKTIEAGLKQGKDIKLRKNDVFYESVILNGVNMTPYGKGCKPIISGWKNIDANRRLWSQGYINNGNWILKNGTNIWRIDFKKSPSSGRVECNSYINNIGLIWNRSNNKTYGHKCQYLVSDSCKGFSNGSQKNTYLHQEMDFFQTSKVGAIHDFSSNDFRYLYLYTTSNPNNYRFSFSTYGNAFSIDHARIDSIRVEGFGCHGFECGNNVKITNCDIDYIGGSQQIGYHDWIRYGNGIEFCGIQENGLVMNNTISHTFDCAVTIQGSCEDGRYSKNIIFKNNLIENCRQALEYSWHRDSKTGYYHDVENCGFINNTCVESGINTGFNSPECRDTHILTYQNTDKSAFKIEGNTFIGGYGFISAQHPELLSIGNNVYNFLHDGFVLWDDCSYSHNIIYHTNSEEQSLKLFDNKFGVSKMNFIFKPKK
jgi:hypothetical protein